MGSGDNAHPSILLHGKALPLAVLGCCLLAAWLEPELALPVAIFAALLVILSTRRLLRAWRSMSADRRDMGEQLFQAQKLAVLGELAAGVAHEINTPMMIIGQEAEIIGLLVDRSALAGTPQAEEIRESVEQIKIQVGRCGGITQGMLQAARKRGTVDQPVDINRLVEDMVVLVERETAMAGVSLVRMYCAGIPQVITDGPSLRQVVLNLLSNAAQAVRDGGKIFVTTALREDHVLIEIRDTGAGIAPEHRDKLFSPFFTTKPAGQGTGLGLSISLRIMNELGGAISVNSEPGLGAAFTIHLPLERVQIEVGQSTGRAWARRMLQA
ncbi:sensor histidine kinase [Desulfocurvibacter africanus]|uniref:sensor histidine kinase n=1 Tax=Desulfocurvibacter africanus TaxID=873 RepID=UPI0004023C63|nr:ATP-binding protein [Desulfocurvibacter africanus]